MMRRLSLLLGCISIGIVAFVCLDYWSSRNAPLFKRLERQWREDVEKLEASGKLPPAWFDIKDMEIIGGTPETKEWLARIHLPPLKTRTDGHYHLEVLVVVWEEDGKRGTLVQYNLEDFKTKNNIYELGRTLILSEPPTGSPWQALLK